MSTGRGSSAARTAPAPGPPGDGPRRPSLALQPFAWSGLQILPVSSAAAESVAVIPPPLPGLHRTAPFRVSEYDKRCRLAVAALEAALGLAEAQAPAWANGGGREEPLRFGWQGRGSNRDLTLEDDELRADLDLSDLRVPLPPGVLSTFLSSADPDPDPGGDHIQIQDGSGGPGALRGVDASTRAPSAVGAIGTRVSYGAEAPAAVPAAAVQGAALLPLPRPESAAAAAEASDGAAGAGWAAPRPGPGEARPSGAGCSGGGDVGADAEVAGGLRGDDDVGATGGSQPRHAGQRGAGSETAPGDTAAPLQMLPLLPPPPLPRQQQQEQQQQALHGPGAVLGLLPAVHPGGSGGGCGSTDLAPPGPGPPGGPGGAAAVDGPQEPPPPEPRHTQLEVAQQQELTLLTLPQQQQQHGQEGGVDAEAGRPMKRQRMAPARYRQDVAQAAAAAAAAAADTRGEGPQPASTLPLAPRPPTLLLPPPPTALPLPQPPTAPGLAAPPPQQHGQAHEHQRSLTNSAPQRRGQASGGRRGRAKARPSPQPPLTSLQGEAPASGPAAPSAAAHGAAAGAAGRSAGAGPGLPRARAREQQRQQQQQQEEQQRQQVAAAAAWWEGLTVASGHLESLKAALQAPSRLQLVQEGDDGAPRQEEKAAEEEGGGRGEGQGGRRRGRRRADLSEERQSSQGEMEREAELRELEEEIERGVRARQRWLTGKADEPEGDGGGGRTARRRRGATGGQAAAAAGVAGDGAYGPGAAAADAVGEAREMGGGSGGAETPAGDGDEGRDGPTGHRGALPAAALAALERIQQAVSGPAAVAQVAADLPHEPRGPATAPSGATVVVGQQPRGGAQPTDDVTLQEELVVWVAVCGPGLPQLLHEEFLVLGSTPLSALRDVLGCVTEDAMRQAARAAGAPPPLPPPQPPPTTASAAAGRGRRRGSRKTAAAGPSAAGEAMEAPGAAAGEVGVGGAGRRGVASAAVTSSPQASPSPPPFPAGGSGGGPLPPSHGSYLFLEGRFFTDVRHPDSEDYTEPIRELCRAYGVRPTRLRPERGWRPALVRDTGGGIPPTAAMHTTCFAELTLRQANHPTGIFCHRACCEHLLFVRDVRRWHPGDPPSRGAFPLRLRVRDGRAGAPVARRRCGVCEAGFAELVTLDDPLAPSNPALMCRHCFDLLHIGSNGERIAPTVVVQPYNPALDIATQVTWAAPAAAWGGAGSGGGGRGGTAAGGGCGGGERQPSGDPSTAPIR